MVSKKALISGEKVCLPEATSGLNIINLELWNNATVTKYLWAIAMKKDSIWIRWVHNVYIKNRGLEFLIIPKIETWVVRKLLATRELVLRLPRVQGDLMSWLIQLQYYDAFNIKEMYKQIRP